MNSGDLNKVWEIRTLKRKPKEDEARKILDRIAAQVQPIMRKHNWRVKLLSEFFPKNGSLLGLNVGAGINVKLRLRRANREEEFLPFHEVLDTMLHELCHNAHGPHNASFYKLWDDLRKECEDLINKGISGTGQGFDLPGRRLGGASRKVPLSALRQASLKAAENRAKHGSLMPSGPKKIGGDSSPMAALSPVQAAAMAAERRLLDNIWCGSELCVKCEEDENTEPLPNTAEDSGISNIPNELHRQDKKVISRKRNREQDEVSVLRSSNSRKQPAVIDLGEDTAESCSKFCSDEMPPIKNYRNDSCQEVSTSESVSRDDSRYNGHCNMWQCAMCTLLNPPLAPICELCTTQRPKDDNLKHGSWSCKFCTLENDVKVEKCAACDVWRYSYGPPIAASAPNRGT